MKLSSTFIALSLSLLAITSCKKDSTTTPATVNCKLTSQTDEITGKPINVIYQGNNPYRVVQSNGAYSQFHFNASNQVDSVKGYDSTGTLTSFSTYTYTSDGKILSNEYTYEDNNNPGTFVANSRNTYEYTGNNVSRSNYYSYSYSTSNISSYDLYEYDASGNRTKDSYYSINNGSLVLDRVTTTTYDSKKAILGDLGKLLGQPSANNPIKNINTYYNPVSTSSDSSSYEYNSNGYPSRITQIYSSGTVYRYSFTYNCN